MVDLIDDRITLKLKHPITDEQWDKITDADFEHTDRICFETKHGKVEFVKVSAQPEQRVGKWIGGELGYCTCCGHKGCASDIWNACEKLYCPNCGAKMEE